MHIKQHLVYFKLAMVDCKLVWETVTFNNFILVNG